MNATEQETSLATGFETGAISATAVAAAIQSQQCDHQAGAYNIFLGQVRNDAKGSKRVKMIEYTCFRDMAEGVFRLVATEAFAKFELQHVRILHSVGAVACGEICLVVLVSSAHRKASFEACEYIVERIKKEAPIWGREILEDETHVWKQNNY